MTASCPGDVRAGARGQVQTVMALSVKGFFFSLWTYERLVEAREDPDGLRFRGGSVEKCCHARAE